MSLAMKCRSLAKRITQRLHAGSWKFPGSRRGNVATIFALSLVPIAVAAGAGLDLSRALVVRARLAEALDAAGLAVGATSGLTNDQMTTLARQYFKANYTADASFGIPADVTVTPGNQNVGLSTTVEMPTTLMNIVGIDTLTVGYTSKIVWGQTKLWVSLVLDNTGSMCEPDSCSGTNNKITALKSATHSLLTTLQNAAANPGDVRVALIPFSKDVNIGTSNVNATWVDWTDWDAAPSNGTPSSSVGPGSNCPYTTSSKGYKCTSGPSNNHNCVVGSNNSCASTIPSSGTYKGYICPSADGGNVSSGRTAHFYNGCFNSVPTQTQTTTVTQDTIVTATAKCTSTSTGTCTSSTTTTNSTTTGSPNTTTTTTSGYTGDSGPTATNGNPVVAVGSPVITSTGFGSNKVYTKTIITTTTTTTTTVTKVGVAPFNHTWIANNHSTWTGCVMDRTQNYDTTVTTPSGSSTNFPAENTDYCLPGIVTSLNYNWSNLSAQVDAMTAAGNTNQGIGFVWGWQALVDGNPMNAGALPDDTKQVIILLSDGLNTQNRWSTTQSTIDARETTACANARTAGITIYTVFVDLNGASGNSAALLSCASDSTKYFDLTTTGSIITTFNNIAQQITQLRVAQ